MLNKQKFVSLNRRYRFRNSKLAAVAATWAVGVLVGTAWLIAAAELDAQRETVEQIDMSRAWAARQVCGENAAWEWVGDKELQCFTHKGHRTGGRVVVASMNASK